MPGIQCFPNSSKLDLNYYYYFLFKYFLWTFIDKKSAELAYI